MTKDEALKLALEALENLEHSNFKRRRLDALIAIKQVLAQTIADEHFAKFDSDINLAVNKAMAQPEQGPDNLTAENVETLREKEFKDAQLGLWSTRGKNT